MQEIVDDGGDAALAEFASDPVAVFRLYNKRAGVENQMARWKGILGEALRFHGDAAEATEVAIAVAVINRMLDLGRPNSVRIA